VRMVAVERDRPARLSQSAAGVLTECGLLLLLLSLLCRRVSFVRWFCLCPALGVWGLVRAVWFFP
jgi:hypothetical protein